MALGAGRHGVAVNARRQARMRASHPIDCVEIGVGHLADRMLADRLELVLHRDLLATEIAGRRIEPP